MTASDAGMGRPHLFIGTEGRSRTFRTGLSPEVSLSEGSRSWEGDRIPARFASFRRTGGNRGYLRRTSARIDRASHGAGQLRRTFLGALLQLICPRRLDPGRLCRPPARFAEPIWSIPSGPSPFAPGRAPRAPRSSPTSRDRPFPTISPRSRKAPAPLPWVPRSWWKRKRPNARSAGRRSRSVRAVEGRFLQSAPSASRRLSIVRPRSPEEEGASHRTPVETVVPRGDPGAARAAGAGHPSVSLLARTGCSSASANRAGIASRSRLARDRPENGAPGADPPTGGRDTVRGIAAGRPTAPRVDKEPGRTRTRTVGRVPLATRTSADGGDGPGTSESPGHRWATDLTLIRKARGRKGLAGPF